MNYQAIVEKLRSNPVLVMDLVKAVIALVVIFGIPIPPGLDIAVAGVLVAVLSVFTRGMVMPMGRVNLALVDALNTPAPAEGESYPEILEALEAGEPAPGIEVE